MCYNIVLQPTVEIINGLPTAVTLAAQGSVREVYIQPGARAQVPHADPGNSHIVLRVSFFSSRYYAKAKFFSSRY